MLKGKSKKSTTTFPSKDFIDMNMNIQVPLALVAMLLNVFEKEFKCSMTETMPFLENLGTNVL